MEIVWLVPKIIFEQIGEAHSVDSEDSTILEEEEISV
jgi:hypothetical protein